MATGCTTDYLQPGRRLRFSSSRLYRLWIPPSLLSDKNRKVKSSRSVKQINYKLVSTLKIQSC